MRTKENIRDSMSFLFVYPARVTPSGGLIQTKSVGRFVISRFSKVRGDISRSLRLVKAPFGRHAGLEHLVLDSTTWSTFHLNNRRSKRVKIGYYESPRILVSFGKSTLPTTKIFQDKKCATIIKLEQNTLPQRIISFSLFSTLSPFNFFMNCITVNIVGIDINHPPLRSRVTMERSNKIQEYLVLFSC